MENKKIAIIVLGAPGSGKTTQAEKLAEEFGLIHFNTSEAIKNIINDPANQSNPIIQREKAIYSSGVLNTDEWVNELVATQASKIFKSGNSVIYSGSPRRLSEAQVLIPELKSLYGKENVFAAIISLGFDVAFERTKTRHVCSVCGLPATGTDDFKKCRKCGGDMIVRSLDNPEKFKIRFDEYHKKTEPVIDYLKSADIAMFDVDGSGSIEEVHQKIAGFIRQHLK